MNWLNGNSGGIQAVGTVLLVIITAMYASVTLTMANRARQQVEMTTRASQVQATLSIIQYLQSPDVRAARAIVRNLKPTTDWMRDWTPDEQSAAASVCASYDAAAMLIVQRYVEPEPLVTTWGPSVSACFRICEPFIRSLKETNGPAYWRHFETMFNMVPESIRKLADVQTAVTPAETDGDKPARAVSTGAGPGHGPTGGAPLPDHTA